MHGRDLFVGGRQSLLFGESEPVCRFNLPGEIEVEIVKKERPKSEHLDTMIDGTAIDFLQELDALVVWKRGA